MKKFFNCFAIILFLFCAINQKCFADCTINLNDRTITFVEDELRFYENSNLLSESEVQTLFPDYKVVLLSDFDKNKKYKMKNSLFGKKKILLLNDTYRTFHKFYIYPESSRNAFKDKKAGEIKSLITVYGKKNVRLKHFGGDEFEITVR